jgi:hypothetical protein
MIPLSCAQPSLYWHRELPPLDAEPLGEYAVEAASARVPDTIAGREALWTRCEDDLMTKARRRLVGEIERLHGRCAHVVGTSIEPRHDGATGEAWLRGRFTYVLYR